MSGNVPSAANVRTHEHGRSSTSSISNSLTDLCTYKDGEDLNYFFNNLENISKYGLTDYELFIYLHGQLSSDQVISKLNIFLLGLLHVIT